MPRGVFRRRMTCYVWRVGSASFDERRNPSSQTWTNAQRSVQKEDDLLRVACWLGVLTFIVQMKLSHVMPHWCKLHTKHPSVHPPGAIHSSQTLKETVRTAQCSSAL
ncbi:uncharacterized protein LOC135377159 [Ornithodoros turicata]|uniref:uncharacterized protein LOC135377159 n=1 Tax=Ornithodoros turicata TaxID=34597 RepID=UPI00313969CC